MNHLDSDARWIKLHSEDWTCPCCGETHQGLFDLACDKPDVWPGAGEKVQNSALTPGVDNILTEDFCVLDGQHYFVRCTLHLPIVGAHDRQFGFGVWSTLSRENFGHYVETFNSGAQGHLGPWFGWFSNRLKGYPDTLNIKCDVCPRDGRQRPGIQILDYDHQLAQEQRAGITFDRLLDLLALNGHDIRTGLTPH